MIRDSQQKHYSSAYEEGRLLVRPSQPTNLQVVSYGLQPLGMDTERDALLYVPKSYKAYKPTPLVLMLHGAGGDARGGLAPFLQFADCKDGTFVAAKGIKAYIARSAPSSPCH